MSDLVANPEDWFSRVAAQWVGISLKKNCEPSHLILISLRNEMVSAFKFRKKD